MLIHLLSVVTLIVCLANAVHSEASGEPAPDMQGCDAAETTLAMRACASTRYANAEKQLNAVYRELDRSLDLVRKVKLHVAQRAWLRFREANAHFQADSARGGTLAPLLEVATLVEMTQARTAELRKVMQR